MDTGELEEMASGITSLIERITDLTYDALREQADGHNHFKDVEKKLSSIRRSLVKAEATLRTLT
jgi:hypothetical protein